MSWLSSLTDSARRAAGSVANSIPGAGTAFGILPTNLDGGGFNTFNPIPKGNQTNGEVNLGGQMDTYKRDQLRNAPIDASTREQLMALPMNQFLIELPLATAGEGKYATRKRNYEHQLLLENRPGAVQLFGDSRGRANAQGGMLTGNPSAGLLTGGGYNK